MRDKITLKQSELNILSRISDSLWNLMNEELEKNGHSDLTLALEEYSLNIHKIVNNKKKV